jgi:nucleotide-binding universal stress UspA family protein
MVPMMLYNNILVAYDGSELGRKALDTAIELAKLVPSAQLQVLHVIRFPVLIIGEAFVPAGAETTGRIYVEAEAIVQQAKDRLAEAGIEGNVEMVEGYPPGAIVDYATQSRCDLIVIGSRGLSGIKELMLGSVSHYVAQRSHIPVFIVKS